MASNSAALPMLAMSRQSSVRRLAARRSYRREGLVGVLVGWTCDAEVGKGFVGLGWPQVE